MIFRMWGAAASRGRWGRVESRRRRKGGAGIATWRRARLEVSFLLLFLAVGGGPARLLGQDAERGHPPMAGRIQPLEAEAGGRPPTLARRSPVLEGSAAPLTLSDALALALETHPSVGQARAAREAAAARLDQAKSTRLPWLAAQASLGMHQEPMIVAPIHSLDMSNPPDFDRNLLQGAVTLGYTLFDGGGRGARIRRAEAGDAAAVAVGAAADMNLIVQVSAAYLGILSGQEILEAVESQRAALEAEAGRVRQFLEEGKAARVDLLRVEAALSRVRASEISARSDLELDRSRLARLTGLSLEAVEATSLASVGPREDRMPSREEVLTLAGTANPELSQARQALAGASAGVREAKAGWFPKIEAGGRYNDFGTLSGGHVQEWQALIQVSYPLFSGGSRSGDQERAAAEERQAAESL
ncbi:MAG: TolC family protein, partial [Longimicrobiales bacterium]